MKPKAAAGPSRNPDQPVICPQCQALLTKGTINEHFVAVHGRQEPKQALPQTNPARNANKAQRAANKRADAHASPKSLIEKVPNAPMEEDGWQDDDSQPSLDLQVAALDEQIQKEISAGFVRCPDCTKKVKRELLAQHYQDKHKKAK